MSFGDPRRLIVWRVEGVPRVMRQLKRLRTVTPMGVTRGLMKAGAFLLRESKKIVPVDTGFLRNSGGMERHSSGFDTVVIIQYTASYAIYVHEDLRARHKPGKTAKYLEKPAREKRREILQIISTEARKG